MAAGSTAARRVSERLGQATQAVREVVSSTVEEGKDGLKLGTQGMSWEWENAILRGYASNIYDMGLFIHTHIHIHMLTCLHAYIVT